MKKEEFKDILAKECFDKNEMEDILDLVDNERDIESLANKIKFLKGNGVSNEAIINAISDNPLFLTVPIDVVKNSVNFLKNVNFTDLDSIVELNSEVITTQDKVLSENFKMLKVLIPEKELLKVLAVDSEILSFNNDYLEKRLEFLIKNGFKDAIKNLILGYFEAFEEDEEDLDLEVMKEYMN